MSDFESITSRQKRIEARKRVFRRRRIRLFCVVCLVLMSFGGMTAFALSPDGADTTLTASRAEVSGDEKSTSAGEPINVLLLGIDRREGEASEEGVRSDAIMVVRVEPESGETRVLSIPRDLFVEVAPDSEDRINAAYALGGVEQARTTVENYTGVEIDHHAVMDFKGFEEGVDALGGVRVEVEEGEYPENWRNVEPGVTNLDGKRALLYARYRDSANGDLDRIGHQQEVLAAVKREFTKVGTIAEIPGLLKAVEGNVASDVGPLEAVSLSRSLAESQRGSGVEAFTLKGDATYLEDGRQVLTPDDQANREIVAEFLK